jgi:hypothetical protein
METCRDRFSIVEYSDELAGTFRDINAQWIDAMRYRPPASGAGR